MTVNKVISILALLCLFAFSVQVLSGNKADVDLWGNAGFVKAFPTQQEFLRINTFSFTDPAKPWIDHEWLAQFIINRVWRILGNPGLVCMKVLIGLLLAGILLASMARDNISKPVRFLLMILLLSNISFGFGFRPHLFTYLFLALFLFMLKHHPGSRTFWLGAMPVIGIIWTNLHGAFFTGILLLLLYSLFQLAQPRDLRKTPALQLAAAGILVLVSFANPYGWRLWSFIATSAAKPRPYLTEWAPFSFVSDSITHPDFLVLVAICILCILFSTQRRSPAWLALLAVALLSALLLKRNIPIFAIAAAFIVPVHADAVASRFLNSLYDRIPKALPALALCLCIAASAWATWNFNKSRPLQIEVETKQFPASIMQLMQEKQISGNALVFFDWAEYAIWHLYPRCRVFMDGRFNDAYSNRTIDDYFNFLYMAPGWEKAIMDYSCDTMLLHSSLPVCKAMAGNRDWTLFASNNIACLFLRTDRHRPVISQAPTLPVNAQEKFPEVLFP